MCVLVVIYVCYVRFCGLFVVVCGGGRRERGVELEEGRRGVALVDRVAVAIKRCE